MKSLHCIVVAGAGALFLPFSAHAAPGGKMNLLPVGTYRCEMPGDASGSAGRVQSDAGFTILKNSRYSTRRGSGSYLVIGDRLQMTSGPMKGQQFKRMGKSFLRRLDAEGLPGRLRCVRSGR